MSEIRDIAGQLYVYIDEEGDAAAINRWRVGPNGGLTADSIARMHVPQKHITRAEINAYAAKFAAVDDLIAALGLYVSICGNTAYSVDRESAQDAYRIAQAALAKAQQP